MFYANNIGLAYIRDRLAQLAKQTADGRHEPAALLKRHAAEGSTFGMGQRKAG